jgi:hypothetical protein
MIKLLWIFAMIMVIFVGAVLSIVALAFASASLLAPFAGLSVMWSAVLAPPVLGETLTKGDIQGAVLIVTGVAVIGLTADKTEKDYDYYSLIALYNSPSFIAYIIVLAFFSMFLYALSRKGGVWRALCLGAVGGTLGGQQYFVKTISELVAANDWSIWKNFAAWAILFCTIGMATGGVALLNKGLREFSSLYIVAVYQSFLVLIGAVSGLCYFQEYKTMKAVQLVFYPFGLLLITAGVVVINYASYQLQQAAAAEAAAAEAVKKLGRDEAEAPDPVLPKDSPSMRSKGLFHNLFFYAFIQPFTHARMLIHYPSKRSGRLAVGVEGGAFC